MKYTIYTISLLISTNLFAHTFKCQDLSYSNKSVVISTAEGEQKKEGKRELIIKEIPTDRANTKIEFVLDENNYTATIRRTLSYGQGKIATLITFNDSDNEQAFLLDDGLSKVICNKVK